jgi:hypothetical protein
MAEYTCTFTTYTYMYITPQVIKKEGKDWEEKIFEEILTMSAFVLLYKVFLAKHLVDIRHFNKYFLSTFIAE